MPEAAASSVRPRSLAVMRTNRTKSHLTSHYVCQCQQQPLLVATSSVSVTLQPHSLLGPHLLVVQGAQEGLEAPRHTYVHACAKHFEDSQQ